MGVMSLGFLSFYSEFFLIGKEREEVCVYVYIRI